MRFHFTSFNHAPPYDLTLFDMYRWLRAGLEECGHQVTYSSDAIDGSAINIIWEGFAPEAGADLASSGVDYGLIVTEFMDGYGFNFGTPMADEDNRRDPVYQARAEGFRAAARGARFFWSMVESNVAPLRDLAPASFVELGYSDSLRPLAVQEPAVEFSFTGILTPHRRRILDALSRRAHVVWYEHLLPIDERDALILATKINLSINKTPDWQMPSPTRVGMAIMGRRGVALDWTPQVTRQSAIVGARPEASDYVDYALDQLHSDWVGRAELAFERLRAEMPMKSIMERILGETLGVAQDASFF